MNPHPGWSSQLLLLSARVTLLCALQVLVSSPLAQAAYQTVLDNGPTSNRVDIVFLGDGYTQSDLNAGVYLDHIDAFMNHMFADSNLAEPFHRYRNFFNVHAIEVVSNQSGADIPTENVFVDTALNASYGQTVALDRALTVNQNLANLAASSGLSGAGFSAEMRLVTVNSSRYGGTGGSWGVFAGGNAQAAEIALHEIGHSFSGLADEYFYEPFTTYNGFEPNEPNVTTDPTGSKWAHWLGYNQPGIGVIDVYEGGRYNAFGIYRPSDNSKMRALNRPFDAISREQIILDIYNLVDPLDDWLDNSSTLVNPNTIWIELVDEQVLDVEWFVDGNLVSVPDESELDLRSLGYGIGDYTVTARVYDPTGFDPVNGWVRINQSNLEQQVSWLVSVTVPEPTSLGTLALSSLALCGLIRRR